jgi:hypothetical protein
MSEPSGWRGRDRDDEERGPHVRQGDPTYDPDDVSQGARRSNWRGDQRYEDTGWTARRNFSGDRDFEHRSQDEFGMDRRDWSRFEREEGGSRGQGQYGAGGFARGGYGQSGYGGDYGQRQHGQTSFGGEGRARSYGEGGASAGRRDEHEFEPDYMNWRNDRLAAYDRDYAQWREDQSRRHDDEYRAWRGERQGLFHRTFEDWRHSRDLDRRTDEFRTDDKVQEVSEGGGSFKARFPDDDGRRERRDRDRSAGADLSSGLNPALQRQAEGEGDREFPAIPRRDDDARARQAYGRDQEGVQTPGSNPALGRIAEGDEGGLRSTLSRREGESDEDYNRRVEAARTSQAGDSAGDGAGDIDLAANPALDKLAGGRDRGKDKH